MKLTMMLTNDDGIDSPGLRLLARELSSKGVEVYVIAPRTQVSGAGKSNSFIVHAEEVRIEGARSAWAIDGKPADAVVIALRRLLPKPPDLVVSGINIGPNMGLVDFFTSGTIGAAIESAILGFRALAASYSVLRGLTQHDMPQLEAAAQLTAELAIRLAALSPPLDGVDIVNVNFPRGKPRGVVMATIADVVNVNVSYDAESGAHHVLGWNTDDINLAYPGGEEGSDVQLVKMGYIAVTPICLRCMIRAAVNPQTLAAINEILRDFNSRFS